jgi:hypothetical protein
MTAEIIAMKRANFNPATLLVSRISARNWQVTWISAACPVYYNLACLRYKKLFDSYQNCVDIDNEHLIAKSL